MAEERHSGARAAKAAGRVRSLVTAAGLMALGAGAWLMVQGSLPPLLATSGGGWLEYQPYVLDVGDPLRWLTGTGSPDSGSLALSLVFLPAIGINAVYFAAPPAWRQRLMAAAAVLLGVEAVYLMLAVTWVSGTGRSPAVLFGGGLHAGSGLVIGAPFSLVACCAAASILAYLGLRSDFEQKRLEYLGRGDAVLRMRPLSLSAHSLWFALGLLGWALMVGWPLASAWTEAGSGQPTGTGARRWPLVGGDDLRLCVMFYGAFVGVAVFAAGSSLAKKALYTGVLAGRIGRGAPPTVRDRWRSLQALQHYPIALAGLALSVAAGAFMPEPAGTAIPDGFQITAAAALAAAAAFAVLGIITLSQVWKSGDDPLHELAIQQGVAFDAEATFRLADRRRSPRTPESPEQDSH